MTLRLPLPEKLHGENLRQSLVQAGYENVMVGEDDGDLEIQAEIEGRPINGRDRPNIEPIIADHPTEPVGEEKAQLEAEAKLRELRTKATEGPLATAEVAEAIRALLLVNIPRRER